MTQARKFLNINLYTAGKWKCLGDWIDMVIKDLQVPRDLVFLEGVKMSPCEVVRTDRKLLNFKSERRRCPSSNFESAKIRIAASVFIA